MSPEHPTKKPILGSFDEIARFIKSGFQGSLIFFVLYQGVYALHLLGDHNSAFAWAVPYGLAAWATHSFHRRQTFKWQTSYWHSLERTLLVYALAMGASTMFQDLLTAHLDWNHNVAFFVTLTVTGGLNYLLLRHWGYPEQVSEPPQS